MKRHLLIVVAWLSNSAVTSYARVLSAQTPVVVDSAKWAAAWKSAWQSYYYRTFDSVVVSAKLSRLRASALPDGHREVRIWFGGGLGAVQDVYRFVDDRGRVSGELIRYWRVARVDSSDIFGGRPGEADADPFYSLRGSCSRFSTGARMYTCRAEFTRSPDWGSVLKRAEAAGLWTLPDQWIPPDGRQITEGWGMIVELRDGSRYRAYHYDNPDIRGPSPENASAVAILAALGAIDSLGKTPDVVKTYRGITTGAYQSEFVDCATGARWEFDSDLRWHAVPVPPATDSTARYVVEIVGELMPEWVARQRNSKYTRVLQIYRLVSVRPALDGVCPNER
jgi:hypothetical protein